MPIQAVTDRQHWLVNNIILGIENTAEQCATPTILSEPTEEIPMNPTTATNAPAFETRHLVYGLNVDSLTESELISAVKQVEGEIADLKAVKTKSSRITAKVKELEEMLTKIVEVLDKK